MNKNLVIGILAGLLVLASLWGQVNNKTKKALEYELKAPATAHSEKVKTTVVSHKADHTAPAVHAVKTQVTHKVVKAVAGPSAAELADAKKMLEVTENQLKGVRQKLSALTGQNKSFQAQLAQKDKALAALNGEKTKLADANSKLSTELVSVKKAMANSGNKDKLQVAALQQKLTEMTNALQERGEQFKKAHDEFTAAAQQSAERIKDLEEKLAASDTVVQNLQEKLEDAEAKAAQLLDESKVASDYEVAQAQVIGLEKIIEEKDAALEETSNELDKLRVNTDVLLSRIADQQDVIQELSNEKRDFIKELASKNNELADLNDQLLKAPVKE